MATATVPSAKTAKPACLGGSPVTRDLVGRGNLRFRRDLERRYLLEAYESGRWDDWPHYGGDSEAGRCLRDWLRFCGAEHGVLVTNGTHALQLALEALEIGPGDEVVVPGLTWQATASAVCDVNAVPVLVDVDPETMCIDPARIEEAITPRTRAIIPVHLYHRLADMDRIRRIARRHDLGVVEDCSHSHGSRWRGRSVGTIGELGTFSMQMSKLITGGEGGAIVARNRKVWERLTSLRACGREEVRGARMHSGNFRLGGFQAAVLRGQIAALRRNASVMDRNGRALDRAVDAAPGVRALPRDRRITRQCSYMYAFFYDREAFDGLPLGEFRRALSAELGVSFMGTYTPLHHSEVYYPHTKKRHRLSARYVRAITPSRRRLPECERLWRDRAVLAPWRAILGCPPKRARLLTDAIAKIYENRAEFLKRSAPRGK
jgi:L-glutamine:2-deoxy-scyllo-inosose/3-amino-2,3-dideoxy-scyllo-inosose aminotransferase